MNTITQINNTNYYYAKNFLKAKQNNCEPTNVQMQQSFKGKYSPKSFFTSWREYIKSLWEGFPATTQIIENKNLKKAMKINPDMTRELYRDNIGYIRGTYTPTMILHIVQEHSANPVLTKYLKFFFSKEATKYLKPNEVDELLLKFKKEVFPL